MKSRKLIIVISVLLVLTGLFAFLHLNNRDVIPENALHVVYNDETYLIDIDKLNYIEVSGSRFNGKGEEIKIDGLGVELKDIVNQLKVYHYSKVTLEADDSYNADVSADEVNENNKVYLLKDENSLRLVVFGDKNSKRSVSNIVEIRIY